MRQSVSVALEPQRDFPPMDGSPDVFRNAPARLICRPVVSTLSSRALYRLRPAATVPAILCGRLPTVIGWLGHSPGSSKAQPGLPSGPP